MYTDEGLDIHRSTHAMRHLQFNSLNCTSTVKLTQFKMKRSVIYVGFQLKQ